MRGFEELEEFIVLVSEEHFYTPPPGLRPGDEILVLNGCQVSSLDLSLIQTLFSENTLHLTVRREPTALTHTPLTHTRSGLRPARDFLYRHHRAKSATGTHTPHTHLTEHNAWHSY